MKKKLGLLPIGLLAFWASANAAPITYEGTLADGVASAGAISGNFNSSSSDLSDYWTFFGNMGDVVTIVVNRIDSNLDPAMWLFEGVFADDGAFGGSIDATDAGFLAFGDDQIPAPGPFGDPRIMIALTLPGTGQYTAIVTDFLSSPEGPQYRYEITASNIVDVAEPGTLGLLGIALFGAGIARRRKAL